MKNHLFFYILLLGLVITDAWLLAHPNLLGKIGVWMYRYDYLKTFPRALTTVGLATGITLSICLVIRRFLSKSIAIPVLWLMALGIAYMLIKTIVQFSSGTYAHTGVGFKTGVILLPFVLLVVVAHNLWEGRQRSESQSPFQVDK